MAIYSGPDVSDKITHACVVGDEGDAVWRGVRATDPEVIAKTLARHAPGLVRMVLETGPLSRFSITDWSSAKCRRCASVRDTPRTRCRCGSTSRAG